ncbi:hypothetical protein GC169_04505 [bacterium]|nr:hypothetical protein [bacterium]
MPTSARLGRTAMSAGCICLLLLSACARGVEHDVRFLDGCWAMRDFEGGPPKALLQLKSNGSADTFEGLLQTFDVSVKQPPLVFAFDRKGRRADLKPWGDGDAGGALQTYTADLLPDTALNALRPGELAAAFDGGDAGWIIAAGTGEQLVIYRLKPDERMDDTLFFGDRERCT